MATALRRNRRSTVQQHQQSNNILPYGLRGGRNRRGRRGRRGKFTKVTQKHHQNTQKHHEKTLKSGVAFFRGGQQSVFSRSDRPFVRCSNIRTRRFGVSPAREGHLNARSDILSTWSCISCVKTRMFSGSREIDCRTFAISPWFWGRSAPDVSGIGQNPYVFVEKWESAGIIYPKHRENTIKKVASF